MFPYRGFTVKGDRYVSQGVFLVVHQRLANMPLYSLKYTFKFLCCTCWSHVGIPFKFSATLYNPTRCDQCSISKVTTRIGTRVLFLYLNSNISHISVKFLIWTLYKEMKWMLVITQKRNMFKQHCFTNCTVFSSALMLSCVLLDACHVFSIVNTIKRGDISQE